MDEENTVTGVSVNAVSGISRMILGALVIGALIAALLGINGGLILLGVLGVGMFVGNIVVGGTLLRGGKD